MRRRLHGTDDLSTQTGSILRPVRFFEPFSVGTSIYVSSCCPVACDILTGVGTVHAKGVCRQRTPVENMNLTHTNLNLKFVSEANFDSHVLQSKSAVLVAFWAPWSKPCHVID